MSKKCLNFGGLYTEKLLDLIDLIPDISEGEKEKISEDIFGEKDKFDFLERITKLLRADVPSRVFYDFIAQSERFSNKTPEQLEAYIIISQRIVGSPSQEIIRMKDQLIEQILATDNPAESYRKIEDIFIKNNLPTIGKIYKIFEELYPPKILATRIRNNASPILRHEGNRGKYYIVYQDLLRTHVESANRSLRQYIEVLLDGESILAEAEEKGFDSLDVDKRTELDYFFGKLNTLFLNSSLGGNESSPLKDNLSLQEKYRGLRESLLARSGQTVTNRIGEMFLRPIELESLADVLAEMKKAKTAAHARGLELARNATDEKLDLREGDLLKGVNDQYISNILQNGSVAKEFLGASADSDSTPLDTDVSMVLEGDLTDGFRGAVGKSLATSYGDLLFAVRDRGQFQKTTQEGEIDRVPGKLELFSTLGGRHYGIRTGFPSTEIDFMVVKGDLMGDSRRCGKIFYEIAQNGYYIPITDIEGKIIFTPEMYAEYRATFNGLDRYDGEPLEFVLLKEGDENFERIDEIAKNLDKNAEKVHSLSNNIRNTVEKVLSESGINVKSQYDTSIIGAELLDIGSTGRHTNMPGDFDFDFTLKLDAGDFGRSAEIADRIKKELSIGKDESHQEPGGYYQLRVMGVTSIADKKLEKPLDIDIGFASKSDLSVFGTHDAIQEKLEWINENIGKDAYQQVIANIILAKEVLKEGHAYKRVEHGGFGGVGVENWILANSGNMVEAFKSFREAAYEGSSKIPFEEFKKKYKLLNAGMNIKHLYHDNYIENLKPEGYEAMLDTIDKYLAK